MAKCREQDLWQGYQADCLWAGGTDMRFTESDEPTEKPRYERRTTLPRWHEVRYPKQKNEAEPARKMTREELIAWFENKA